MPTLELTEDMVGDDRSRLTLAYIESVMLWPNDPLQRKLSLRVANAAQIRHRAARLIEDCGSTEIVLDVDHFLTILDVLGNAPALSEMQEAGKEPFKRGVVAACIFLETLRSERTGRARNLQQVKAGIIKRLAGKQHFEHLSQSTVENVVWRVYRPVAHLWAAYYLVSGRNGPFPCRLREFPRFLSVSERLRLDGERFRTGRGTTLIDPFSAWTVPPELGIEPTVLEWRS